MNKYTNEENLQNERFEQDISGLNDVVINIY